MPPFSYSGMDILSLKMIQFQPLCQEQGHLSLDQMDQCSVQTDFENFCDRTSPASLGNLFYCLPYMQCKSVLFLFKKADPYIFELVICIYFLLLLVSLKTNRELDKKRKNKVEKMRKIHSEPAEKLVSLVFTSVGKVVIFLEK